MKLPLVILFVCLALPASARQLLVSDLHGPRAHHVRKVCALMVSNLTRPLIEHPEHDFHFGGIADIEALLVASRVAPVEASAVAQLIEGFKNPAQVLAPNLRETFGSLRNPKVADRLFLAVTSEQYDLTNGASAYFNAYFENLETLRTKVIPEGPYAAGRHGIRRKINLLLNRYPTEELEEQRPFIFVVNLMHEVRHFLDVDFISRWIKANRSLLLLGHRADPLFRRFVRIARSEDEVISLDSAFYTAFLESNGYAINDSLYRMFYYPEDYEPVAEQLRDLAFADIVESAGGENEPEGVDDFLSENDITNANVLEVGARWRAQMQITIESASKLNKSLRKRAG